MEEYEVSRRLKSVQREKGKRDGGEKMKENDKLIEHFIFAHGWPSLYQMMRKWYMKVFMSVSHGSALCDV